jgi:hypothetical protein
MSDDIHKTIIQTRAPRGKDPGKIAEGWYCVVDGHVVLTDEVGKPLGDSKRYLGPDGDARVLAARMMRGRSTSSASNFNQKISYPKLKY